ncbi:MAG: NAD-dependent deacylase [Bacteroidetes bacterium]|nr:NAD-dependent deacylase [Bacteroidota bacterium]
MSRKKIVFFTGAGVSAESGLKTFRDTGGLWEQHKIEDVATPEAWQKNPTLVLEFYNQRRTQANNAKPNKAHLFIASLQQQNDVTVITQNVDDLHEKAGSKKILHLHGELNKAQSTIAPELIYDIKTKTLNIGNLCEKGSQLRPHIVWFGEPVPAMDEAYNIVAQADLLIVIGTSLNVYPAAGLLPYANKNIPKWLVDPGNFNLDFIENLTHIKETAVNGIKILEKQLLNYLNSK